MRIGIPRESLNHEHRVGLTPAGVAGLVRADHEVIVERGAGDDSHFTDEDYQRSGATVVYQPDEIYQRADLVARVGPPTIEEVGLMQPGTAVAGFLHTAVMPRDVLELTLARDITTIGYEIMEGPAGRRLALMAISEVAGHLAVHTAAHLLQTESGGRGVILGDVPCIPRATVLVLGAGTVGGTAARLLNALGAHVIVLDRRVERLRELHDRVPVTTAVATPDYITHYAPVADAVIGAVLVPGGRAPYLVSEEMIKEMKPGSVIIDIAIDQGGCVETSRPTTLADPTYKVHGVTHYCVPNMTANAPRTSSRAVTTSVLPQLTRIATEGLIPALQAEPGIAKALYTYKGHLVNAAAAAAHARDAVDLATLL